MWLGSSALLKCSRREPSRLACLLKEHLGLRLEHPRVPSTEWETIKNIIYKEERTHVVWINFRVETTCSEKENVRRRFSFFKFGVGALCDMMEQLEDLLMILCFHRNTFVTATSCHTNWNAVGVEMFYQSFCAGHKFYIRQALL